MSPKAPKGELEAKLAELPDSPGVYLFSGRKGKVIYVGKALSLRKRVSSYFGAGAQREAKTRTLVSEIRDLDWLVCQTEVEALVLENSLIKKNRPRYNINLRDDKNFPHIKLTTSERWPRFELVRGPRRDEDSYFGPYVPAATARKTMRLLAQDFGLRSCKGPIEEKDHRACLYYHLDQCLAPCASHCTQEEYDGAVKDAVLFLNGKVKPLKVKLQAKMQAASDREAYERAAHYRDLIKMVDESVKPQRMASTGLEQQDVWGLCREGSRAMLVVGLVREGQVRGSREFILRDAAESTSDGELVGEAVRRYYHGASYFPDEILLPFPISQQQLTSDWLRSEAERVVKLLVPQRGQKTERLAWVEQNARVAFSLKLARGDLAKESVTALGEALSLSVRPDHIECFDISNIQGSEIGASMVVFRGGEPAKSEYRHFNMKTVAGAPDDFASIEEAVGRRYRRLLTEEKDLPELVVIDGGLGQLHAAAKALDSLELQDLPLISIAKQEELLHVRGQASPLRLPRTAPALKLVQRLRDEAHRVAITHHRRRRRARTLVSELDEVPGIGPAKRRVLLQRFGSVQGVKDASLAELSEVVSPKLARTLVIYLGTELGESG